MIILNFLKIEIIIIVKHTKLITLQDWLMARKLRNQVNKLNKNLIKGEA